MLYNSLEFILVFLPITLAVYRAIVWAKWGRIAAVSLVVASLIFYAWWDFQPGIGGPSIWRNYLWLLLGSIIFNYAFGSLLRTHKSRGFLALGITINLAALAYYKYAGFLIGTINSIAGSKFPLLQTVLPLGISFFTFTQIAFLVDAFRNQTADLTIGRYFLFVTFFPHLIAGPIVHHRDMMSQFADPESRRWIPQNVHAGMVLFVLGLTKKVLIADTIGRWARPVFDSDSPLHFADAWSGVLAYTLQLYFDFSGYTDMAIGLALLFNIRMPDNFNAPYQASSIIDFWQRWHMTLSRFLRDYLYIPLGGNRKGPGRRHVNLLITMLLGGLWHGAGWTYVIWGGYHGVLLSATHAWRSRGRAMPNGLARLLTLLAVMVGWVFFRSSSMKKAGAILHAMAWPFHEKWYKLSVFPASRMYVGCLIGLLIFLNIAPTSRQWLETRRITHWHAIVFGIVFFFCLLVIRDGVLTNTPNLFIYFQF